MADERRHPNVIHQDELPAQEVKKGKHHLFVRRFGPTCGNQALGATITELPAGAISFPFHYHCAIEEAIYVVSGKGTARLGGTRVPVRAGDWIAMPIGPAHAHQMINDSDAPLVYLCVSSTAPADVMGYPDSKKIATRAGTDFNAPWIRTITREAAPLDYWDGEPEATE